MRNALIVDDSKLARLSLGKILEKLGFAVYSTENGRQAVDFLKRTDIARPDVIFMDYLMPEMNGYEATQIISSDPRTRHIPVIICTAQEDVAQERERARSFGARGFIKKPITDEKINRALDDVKSSLFNASSANSVSNEFDTGTFDKADSPTKSSVSASYSDQGGSRSISQAEIQAIVQQAVSTAIAEASKKLTEEITIKVLKQTKNVVVELVQKTANSTIAQSSLKEDSASDNKQFVTLKKMLEESIESQKLRIQLLEQRITRIEQFLSKKSS